MRLLTVLNGYMILRVASLAVQEPALLSVLLLLRLVQLHLDSGDEVVVGLVGVEGFLDALDLLYDLLLTRDLRLYEILLLLYQLVLQGVVAYLLQERFLLPVHLPMPQENEVDPLVALLIHSYVFHVSDELFIWKIHVGVWLFELD